MKKKKRKERSLYGAVAVVYVGTFEVDSSTYDNVVICLGQFIALYYLERSFLQKYYKGGQRNMRSIFTFNLFSYTYIPYTDR